MIFYDSQEIINFYVSLSVLAHCGFNQDVVTKCLTSESRHEARVRGSHPAQLSHLHMKLFQLALWELCLTKFLFNGVGTEKSLFPSVSEVSRRPFDSVYTVYVEIMTHPHSKVFSICSVLLLTSTACRLDALESRESHWGRVWSTEPLFVSFGGVSAGQPLFKQWLTHWFLEATAWGHPEVRVHYWRL